MAESLKKLSGDEYDKMLAECVKRVLGDIGFSNINISGYYETDTFKRVIVEIRNLDDKTSIREHVPTIQDKTGAECVVVERESVNTEELSVDFSIQRS